jgi:type I restriction enzyme M protein
MSSQATNKDGPNGAALFEACNKLRGSVESAEYKHLVLGLIFLKYISDSFEHRRRELEAELSDPSNGAYVAGHAQRRAELDDRDAYLEKDVFWVPESARWEALLQAASQPEIAKRIDDALEAIERENPPLRDRAAAHLRARAAVGAVDGFAGGDDRQDRLWEGPA